jgi:CheY-like chemotaxis protein
MSESPILVVDDDETILVTVADFLEMEGYPVATASNGREALQVVERSAPALVLLDMRMPVLDGWGFAQAVHERGLALRILVMSAAADARKWAHEIGAFGVVPKPFELDDLLHAVVMHYPKR